MIPRTADPAFAAACRARARAFEPRDPLDLYPSGARVLLLGPLPPPPGGISVHLERLSARLAEAGRRVEVLPLGPGRLRPLAALAAALLRGPDIVHLHVLHLPAILLLLLLLPRRARLLFTDHGLRMEEIARRQPLRHAAARRLLPALFRRLDALVAVGPHLPRGWRAFGCTLPRATLVRNAFLLPRLADEARLLASVDPRIAGFIASASPLLVTNAHSPQGFDGVDLYGLDLCVEVVARLAGDFPRIGLLALVTDPAGSPGVLAAAKRRAGELGVAQRIHWAFGDHPGWPLNGRADLFLRPTCRDGYGVALAETLSFGRPAVASDCCLRPPGTRVFRNRDLEDFERACREALAARRAEEGGGA